MASPDFNTEKYTEDLGIVFGRMTQSREGTSISSAALGVGRVSAWEMNNVPGGSSFFPGGRRMVRGDRTDSIGALLEAAYYPSANGGAFAWGFQILGAISQASTHLSAGITLGLGRTP